MTLIELHEDVSALLQITTRLRRRLEGRLERGNSRGFELPLSANVLRAWRDWERAGAKVADLLLDKSKAQTTTPVNIKSGFGVCAKCLSLQPLTPTGRLKKHTCRR